MPLRMLTVVLLAALAACSGKFECPAGKTPQWVADSSAPGGSRVECR